MSLPRVLLCCTFALLCAPLGVASAQFTELQPGVRARVRAPGDVAGRLTGVVLARTADSVTITRPNATPITVALSKLSSIEISRGKSRGRGALKGLAWGGAIGVGLGLTPISDSTCTGGSLAVRGDCEPVSRAAYMASILGGSLMLGAGIGAIVGSERWESYALPTRVSVLLPTRTRSTGLMVSWIASGPRRRD